MGAISAFVLLVKVWGYIKWITIVAVATYAASYIAHRVGWGPGDWLWSVVSDGLAWLGTSTVDSLIALARAVGAI